MSHQTRIAARSTLAVLLAIPLRTGFGQVPGPSSDEAVLRPGDAVRIDVWRHPELSGEFVIAPDSSLVHPLYQTVIVAGAPLSQVRGRLGTLLARYETDVQFVIEPLFPVTIAGEVRQPNLYRLPQGTTFSQAIALAGGPTELGQLDRVRVIRRQGELSIDLAAGYARYEALVVASGDQVLIPRRSNFNLVRDLLVPVTSLTGAIAAILAYTSR